VLYRVAKLILGTALREFFSSITVRGTPCEEGPVVLVANHQNLALDSLLIPLCCKRKVWALGKATLFAIPVLGWLLRSLGVAPLYRRDDDPSQLSKNTETFDAIAKLLHQGGAVMLFPEGVSMGERALQPIKTGAARMALQAESQAQFGAEVLIQPVGITYSDLTLFRSTVTLVFDQPIAAAQFKEQYLADPRKAVGECTAAIEAGLRKVSVNIADQRQAHLVERLARVYRAEGRGADDFERFTLIAKNVEIISATNPMVREEIDAELTKYEQQCAALGIEPEDSLPMIARQPHLGTLLKALVYRIRSTVGRRGAPQSHRPGAATLGSTITAGSKMVGSGERVVSREDPAANHTEEEGAEELEEQYQRLRAHGFFKACVKPLLAPWIVLAVVTLWIPYRCIGIIVRRICSDPVYIASTKFFLGLVIFPLWFVLLALLLLTLGLEKAWIAALLSMVLISAFIANRYLPELRTWLVYRVVGFFNPGDSPGVRLAKRHAQLIERLDKLRAV